MLVVLVVKSLQVQQKNTIINIMLRVLHEVNVFNFLKNYNLFSCYLSLCFGISKFLIEISYRNDKSLLLFVIWSSIIF